MLRFNPKNNFFTVVVLLITLQSYAHGSLSVRINELTIEISKDSKNPKLYFERGYLYQQHKEYKKAIKDFLKCDKLNYLDNQLTFRLSETYYLNEKFKKALKTINKSSAIDSSDFKVFKLKAQILFKLNRYNEAIVLYNYLINSSDNLRPEDIIEYSNIILAIDKANYSKAIDAIEFGLAKIGENTLTLQLKKLDYLIASNQTEEVIKQYNYFILNNSRKEFWYYKKADYLKKISKHKESNIALQQAKLAIELLSPKFQNTLAVKDLQAQINELEKTLML